VGSAIFMFKILGNNKMKFNKCALFFGACSLLIGSAAFAQNSLDGETVTTSFGASGQISFDYVDGGAGSLAWQATITIANPDITVTAITCTDPNVTCPGTASNMFNVAGFNAGGIPSIVDAIVIDYDVADPATPAAAPVTITNTAGTITTTTDGTINIVDGPSLVATPANLALAAAVNATDTDTFDLSVMNGTVNNLACAGTGDPEITYTGTIPTTLSDAGPPVTVTAACTSAAAGNFTSSFDCTFDGGGALSVPVTCAVTAGAAVPAVDPVTGSTITIGPLAPSASGDSPIVFSETNNQGTGYAVANCVLATGTNFTIDATGVMVPAGGSATITVTGTAPADGTAATDTLTCDINGVVGGYTANLEIALQPQIVPTLSQWAMIIMALALAGFGVVTMRRRANG